MHNKDIYGTDLEPLFPHYIIQNASWPLLHYSHNYQTIYNNKNETNYLAKGLPVQLNPVLTVDPYTTQIDHRRFTHENIHTPASNNWQLTVPSSGYTLSSVGVYCLRKELFT